MGSPATKQRSDLRTFHASGYPPGKSEEVAEKRKRRLAELCTADEHGNVTDAELREGVCISYMLRGAEAKDAVAMMMGYQAFVPMARVQIRRKADR